MLMVHKNKKLYKHDCKECIFLGSDEFRDFYFCPKSFASTNVSLIVRLSDKPGDYCSMPINIAEQGILSGVMTDSAFHICYKLYENFVSD